MARLVHLASCFALCLSFWHVFPKLAQVQHLFCWPWIDWNNLHYEILVEKDIHEFLKLW